MTTPSGHDLSAADERPFSIPPDIPVLPLRDTVLFPNSFMPLAVARESSVKLIDDAIAGGKVIGVFTQTDPTARRAGPGGPASDWHAHAHPQDVQAAGRQPAPDRAGAGPHPADAYRVGAPVPARGDRRGARGVAPGRRAGNRRPAAQRARELPADRPAVPGAVRRPRDAGGQHRRAGPGGRLHRVEPDDGGHQRQAGPAGDARRARAPRRTQPHPHQGTRGARTRLEDPVAGAVRSGQATSASTSCASR